MPSLTVTLAAIAVSVSSVAIAAVRAQLFRMVVNDFRMCLIDMAVLSFYLVVRAHIVHLISPLKRKLAQKVVCTRFAVLHCTDSGSMIISVLDGILE